MEDPEDAQQASAEHVELLSADQRTCERAASRVCPLSGSSSRADALPPAFALDLVKREARDQVVCGRSSMTPAVGCQLQTVQAALSTEVVQHACVNREGERYELAAWLCCPLSECGQDQRDELPFLCNAAGHDGIVLSVCLAGLLLLLRAHHD